MGRPVVRQRNIKIGNYRANVEPDPEGVLESVQTQTPLTKVEKDYVKGTRRTTAMEAVRRARRANKQPPPKE